MAGIVVRIAIQLYVVKILRTSSAWSGILIFALSLTQGGSLKPLLSTVAFATLVAILQIAALLLYRTALAVYLLASCIICWSAGVPLVEVPGCYRESQQLEVEEELVLVIDEVFEVSQQDRHHRFALANKDRRNKPRKLIIGD